MPLIETALAFIVAMLAASLFVSAAVELLQRLGKFRAGGLQEMLTALIHGFRVYHNDEQGKPEDHAYAYRRFVEDVLGDPVFYARSESLDVTQTVDGQPHLMEQITADDLMGVVYNYCRYYDENDDTTPEQAKVQALREPSTADAVEDLGKKKNTDGAEMPDLPLPPAWIGAKKEYATTSNLATYVKRWFDRLCLTATERYRTRILRLTTIVATLVVVLFNLDGFQLVRNLYDNAGGRARLTQEIPSLQATADRLGIGKDTGTSETNKELGKEMLKTATILDGARIGLGWQDSPIVKEWCTYRPTCAETTVRPTLGRLLMDTFLWLGGLVFSVAMLSLGSPFWYRALAAALSLRRGGQPEAKTVENKSKPNN